nr:hypothetical protein [Tanacetum cinerariifolium]
DPTPIRQYSRRARIAQSSALPTVADKPVSPVRDVSEGEACPTESGFIADQDRATIAKISNDSEEIARVLTSMDAATVLVGGIDVPTGSGSILTAGPPATIISTGSEVGPTASPIATRRKGNEVMVESDTPKKKRLQEQIDAQVVRELEEQQEKDDMRMNEQIARDAEVARIHTNSQDNYSKVYKFQSQQRRLMTKKQKREYYMAMIRNNLGWRVKDFKEFTEEKVKEMMQLVPVEDVYVQALQVKHHIIDWKVHTKGQRS